MRLESVSLHGFKSFAEKSVLKVMPGITAIVGPNGCGKSNISESVRWALGEQSAKSLRGQRMEDLIFHGSASRKPVGFAEVELIFSNDGVLSVPWTEVAVSRRLYRTGESEYLLNKNPSRLRDILDLFAGTGANPRAYSVMDQDKLNHVLTAKPHERRVFIEEAAGIARYKQQRNETQGKLDAARQNLVRVRDVMDEERREQMGVQIRELGDENVRLDEEVRAATERLSSIVSEREEVRRALRDAEQLAADRSRASAEFESAVERQRAALALERDHAEALRLEQTRLAGERIDLMRSAGELREREAQLGRRAERLAAELAPARPEADRLVSARAALTVVRNRAAAEFSSLEEERRRLDAEEADETRRAIEAEARLADARVALAARRSSFEALSELERAREGYGAGVRAVFAEDRRVALPGVVGTVADLLEVPPGMERAIEAVLGERLQWVVVERFEHARTAVAYLRDHGLGSATFLPLEHLPVADGPGPDDNSVRWVTRSVGANAPHLVHHLLAQVAIVDHLDEAEALWRRNGVVATYVTPGGEVLGPTGRLHGGENRASAATEHSLLARKRQLRDLEGEVQRLSAVVDAGQTDVTTLGASVVALREQSAGLGRSVQARLAERLAGEKDLERSAQEHERVLRHLETISAESQQVAREAEETGATLARLTQRIAVARNAEEAIEAAAAKVREAIESAQADETALGAELTACRVDLASATERVEALGRELPRLDEIGRDLAQRLAQAGQRQTQLTERRAWLADERERTDLAAREVAVERDRTDAAARHATEEHDGLTAELRAVEHDSRGAESELGRLVASAHEIDIHSTECRVRP